MNVPRPGLVDLGILTVVAVALFLPAREMYASPAIAGDDAKQFALALAEARTIARPSDGLAVEEFGRRLGESNMKDWAIEATVRASEHAKGSPTRWRALLAASVAFVDKIEVKEALDYANRALEACEAAKDASAGDVPACPTYEQIRMQLYQQHLDAGMRSGIDPHQNPIGFRKAGEAALHSVRLKALPDQGLAPAKTGSGSGSAAGSGQ